MVDVGGESIYCIINNMIWIRLLITKPYDICTSYISKPVKYKPPVKPRYNESNVTGKDIRYSKVYSFVIGEYFSYVPNPTQTAK